MKIAPALAARLLDDKEAAEYLGTSRSYVRALVANQVLPRIGLPATDGNGSAARLLRIDRADLDALILRSKTGGRS